MLAFHWITSNLTSHDYLIIKDIIDLFLQYFRITMFFNNLFIHHWISVLSVSDLPFKD